LQTLQKITFRLDDCRLVAFNSEPKRTMPADRPTHHLAFEAASPMNPFVFCIATTPSGDRSNMGPRSLIREAWEMIPILLLLMVGGMIALKSGVRRSGRSQNLRQVAGNLSQITFRVLGYVAVLLALQYWIGLRPQLGW
jgi:hypothetical protein